MNEVNLLDVVRYLQLYILYADKSAIPAALYKIVDIGEVRKAAVASLIAAWWIVLI